VYISKSLLKQNQPDFSFPLSLVVNIHQYSQPATALLVVDATANAAEVPSLVTQSFAALHMITGLERKPVIWDNRAFD